ncbi:MAG: hypothetical protein SNJ57_16405 [Cyanobacteriota bacterium]
MPSSSNSDLKTYDSLLTAIEFSEGQLGLLLAVCDDRQRQTALIASYERDLAPQIRAYRLALDYDEPSLKGAIYQVWKQDDYLQQGGRAVLTLEIPEPLLQQNSQQDDIRRDQFFGYLQWTREGLREFRYPIVIWMPSLFLDALSHRAPDFWSWRKGVFRFL